jgi:(p)ppGpp synthase/HD superfamily hydrolase
MLSASFVAALIDAERHHHLQVRKSTSIPYFSHLMAVSALVLDAGGSEIEAIAALLHDAPEDCGGAPVLAEIEEKFGPEVGAIVDGCSDAFPLVGEEKVAFRARKEAYIAHLRGASASTMLVSAADKLHNLRSIQADYDVVGDAVFDRFSALAPKRQNVLWYYRSLYDVYTAGTSPVDVRRDRLTVPLGRLLAAFAA